MKIRQYETSRKLFTYHLGDIGRIIRKADGLKDATIDIKHKSRDTQALYLFSIGKTPLEVAIELDVPTSEIHDLQEEFWALNQLHELAFAYDEIKNFLSSFLKLYHILKERKMLREEYLVNLLKYMGQDIPELTNRLQQLSDNVIDLKSKKRQSLDALIQLDDTLDWYRRNIKLK